MALLMTDRTTDYTSSIIGASGSVIISVSGKIGGGQVTIFTAADGVITKAAVFNRGDTTKIRRIDIGSGVSFYAVLEAGANTNVTVGYTLI